MKQQTALSRESNTWRIFGKYKKEFLLFLGVYLVWAFIELKLKLALTPAFFDGTLELNQRYLLLFKYFNNEQSRILQWAIPQFLTNTLHLQLVQAYILQRFLFIFLTFILFHFYLRKWFSALESFGGVACLAAIMPLTYMNDLQESSNLLLLTFLLALWLIRQHKTFLLFLVMIVGLLNNETMAVIPLAYFLYNFQSFKLKALGLLIAKTFLVSLPIFLVLLPIRYLTRDNPHLGGPYYILPYNLANIVNQLSTLDFFNLYQKESLFIFLLFGVFWLFAFKKFPQKPLFLKRVTYMMPVFIVLNLITGIISEVRQMLPLAFIIIPNSLLYIKQLVEREAKKT